MTTVQIRQAAADEVVDLRHRVLRGGLPREMAVFAGDETDTSRHFVAVEAGEVVGCLTLHGSTWAGEAAYQLRGMATAHAVRGRGIGRLLMESAEGLVRATPTRWMWCNARLPAAGFYKGMGWQVVSEVFDIPTAGPHVRMLRDLQEGNFKAPGAR